MLEWQRPAEPVEQVGAGADLGGQHARDALRRLPGQHGIVQHTRHMEQAPHGRDLALQGHHQRRTSASLVMSQRTVLTAAPSIRTSRCRGPASTRWRHRPQPDPRPPAGRPHPGRRRSRRWHPPASVTGTGGAVRDCNRAAQSLPCRGPGGFPGGPPTRAIAAADVGVQDRDPQLPDVRAPACWRCPTGPPAPAPALAGTTARACWRHRHRRRGPAWRRRYAPARRCRSPVWPLEPPRWPAAPACRALVASAIASRPASRTTRHSRDRREDQQPGSGRGRSLVPAANASTVKPASPSSCCQSPPAAAHGPGAARGPRSATCRG